MVCSRKASVYIYVVLLTWQKNNVHKQHLWCGVHLDNKLGHRHFHIDFFAWNGNKLSWNSQEHVVILRKPLVLKENLTLQHQDKYDCCIWPNINFHRKVLTQRCTIVCAFIPVKLVCLCTRLMTTMEIRSVMPMPGWRTLIVLRQWCIFI